MLSVRWFGGLVGTLTFLASMPALAEPVTAGSIQLGLGFRYGAEMNEGDFNPWGAGIGFNAGITLPNAVYVGGVAEYFFGEEVDGVSSNIWQLMGEGGYDLGLGPTFVLRPKLGLGFANTSAEICVEGFGCEDDSSTDFALAPGATFMIFLPALSLSADVRYEFVFAEETAKALIFSAGVGF
jgi:hypothetical protein